MILGGEEVCCLGVGRGQKGAAVHMEDWGHVMSNGAISGWAGEGEAWLGLGNVCSPISRLIASG